MAWFCRLLRHRLLAWRLLLCLRLRTGPLRPRRLAALACCRFSAASTRSVVLPREYGSGLVGLGAFWRDCATRSWSDISARGGGFGAGRSSFGCTKTNAGAVAFPLALLLFQGELLRLLGLLDPLQHRLDEGDLGREDDQPQQQRCANTEIITPSRSEMARSMVGVSGRRLRS